MPCQWFFSPVRWLFKTNGHSYCRCLLPHDGQKCTMMGCTVQCRAISYHMLDAKERWSNLSFPLIFNFLPYLIVICKSCPLKYVMVILFLFFCNNSVETPFNSLDNIKFVIFSFLHVSTKLRGDQDSSHEQWTWMDNCMMYNFKNKVIQLHHRKSKSN